MKFATRFTRLTAWVAIFAILLAALAPGVARAVSSSQKAMPWNEICTVAGTQPAHQALPESGSGHHDAAPFTHCPFCLGYAGHVALLPVAIDALPPTGAGAEFFPPSATTSPPRFMRAAAQPRAPPAIS